MVVIVGLKVFFVGLMLEWKLGSHALRLKLGLIDGIMFGLMVG